MATGLGTPVPLTELAAVNLVLRVGGGVRPTTTLGDGNTVEGVKAQSILLARTYSLLETGYAFNTDFDVELEQDASGHVYVPNNSITLTPKDAQANEKYVKRGNRLWNRDGGTWVIGTDLTVDIVRVLDFEDMIPEARWLAALQSALEYSNDYSPGDGSARITSSDLAIAKDNLERADRRLRTGNRTRKNPHFRRMRGLR